MGNWGPWSGLFNFISLKKQGGFSMDNQTYERPEIKEFYARDLLLSKTNPRFPKPVSTEEEAILTFFQLKKVGPKKIEALIQDIVESQGVLEDFIVLQEDEEYIVYDGNRRLTALKLFINDNADIIKESYPSTYQFICNVKKEINISDYPLYAKVYSDSNSMANHVLKIHSGEQQGIGQITWESNEKDSFAAHFLNRPLSFGNLVYKKIEQSPDKKELFIKIQNKGYATTFDRIFNFADIRKRIFNLDRGEKVDLDNNIHFEKVCEMITYFVLSNANVTNVYLKDHANDFFSEISSIVKHGKDSLPKSELKPNPEPKLEPKPEPDPEPNPEPNPEPKPETYNIHFELKTNKKEVLLYEDFNLTNLVKLATDTNGQNLQSLVKFYSTTENLIKDNVFSGDAPIGSYHLQAKIENEGIKLSKSFTINVVLPNKKVKINVPKNELFKSVTSFANGDVRIEITSSVDMLIKEIQSIENAEDYALMIASSVRQLIELSTGKVISDKKLKDHGNLKDNFIFLVEQHIVRNKKLLTEICKADNDLKFQPILNLIGSIDADKLYSYLHLITHDSNNSIYSELVEKINKQITPLLAVFHNYLKLNDK